MGPARTTALPLVAAAVACGALAGAFPATAAACAGADDVQTAANVAQAKAAMLCLLNAQRTAGGLRPLAVEPHLDRSAQGHSLDMVRRRYFSHRTLGGLAMIPRLLRSGFHQFGRRWEFGEAIGFNYGAGTTPRRMLAQLLGSPLHRAWLLGARFTHVGIGVAAEAPYPQPGHPGVTYTLDVGLRG